MKTEIDVAETGEQAETARLSTARRGERGVVFGLAPRSGHGVSADELERRLLEIGFVEGARFEVLHVGLIGADPLIVRLDDTRIALRRREAETIAVTFETT